MKENLIHARTCVYNINYHVVWSVKYRRKVLTEEIEQTMKQWAVEIGEEKGEGFSEGKGLSSPKKVSVQAVKKPAVVGA